MAQTETGLIEVKVVYPSAHGPAVEAVAPATTVRQVKDFALSEFGLKEETMPDGSKIVFFMYFEKTKIENLDQSISGFEHPNDKVNFRLAKEVIAGLTGMDPIQARINLQADLEKIADVIVSEGWTIDPWPLTSTMFFVAMKSVVDGEAYTMRLIGDDYPDCPASIKCVNPETRDVNDPKAWPSCEGFRPTTDLCLSVSREALMQVHPEWMNDRRYRWTPEGNPVWNVLQSLQDRLNDRGKYMAGTSKYFAPIETFTLPATLLDKTLATLRAEGQFCMESLVFWAGSVDKGTATVTHIFVPKGEGVFKHPLQVRVDDRVIAALCGELDPPRLVLLGQVHTHLEEAFHSSTDDRFSLDTPGFVSIVIPHFGRDGAEFSHRWALYECEGGGRFREIGAAERARRFLVASDGAINVRDVSA